MAPPVIEDLRNNGTAAIAPCPSTQCVDALATSSGTRSVQFRKEVTESHGGASAGEGAPARCTRLLGGEAASNPFFQVMEEELADDPFEPLPLDTHFVEETENAYSPLPPSGDQVEQVWTDAEAEETSNPCLGASPPNECTRALHMFGTPARSGLVEASDAHDAPRSVPDTHLGNDPEHPTQDSLAISMGSRHVEQELDETQAMQQEQEEEEEEEEEEDAPRASRPQRYSKVKRDRYRSLVDRLIEKYREDPASFDLSQQYLPPGIAASDALKEKLLATVVALARSSASGASASSHQVG